MHNNPKAWYSGPRGVSHVNSSVKISKKLIGPDYHRLGTTVRLDGTGPYHLGSRALKKSEKVLQLGFEIRPPLRSTKDLSAYTIFRNPKKSGIVGQS